MVKIRLEGTYGEVNEAKEIIESVFNILNASEPYANRGTSKYVRVYIDAEIQKENTTVHQLIGDVAEALRTSSPHNRVSVSYQETENQNLNVGEETNEQ